MYKWLLLLFVSTPAFGQDYFQDRLIQAIKTVSTKDSKAKPLPVTHEEVGGKRAMDVNMPGSEDAFGRLTTANPKTIFESKMIHNKKKHLWDESTTGGSSISYDRNTAAVTLTNGTADGDIAIRQTYRYFEYHPGKSHEIKMTGVMGAAKTNLIRRIGYFDSDNGAYFIGDETGVGVGIRTKTTGSAVDSITYQSDWNLDKLDGTGSSGLSLDVTKAQIFVIKFQWLGVGSIMFGFNIEGVTHFVHRSHHANNLAKVYMSTPTLPVRYEIENDGAVASNSSLIQICADVVSSGGQDLLGQQVVVGYGTDAARNISARTPVFAVRTASSYGGGDNRRQAQFIEMHAYVQTNDTFLEIVKYLPPEENPDATWVSANDGESGLEYSIDIVSILSQSYPIESNYVNATNKVAGNVEVKTEFQSDHQHISQNIDSSNSSVIVIFATPMTGSADVRVSVDMFETE
jgi:hypothetical protein